MSRLIQLVAVLLCVCACAPPTPEAIDAEHVAGRWTLDTGSESEWFHLEADGTYTAQIRQNGFIAATLSQGAAVDLRGDWELADRTISLTVTHSSGPKDMTGQVHSYEILELTDQEMVTSDATGRRQTLRR